jgi:two-component system copper resistance phosphate regulon response regulator CusR
MRILLVEDETKVASFIKRGLEQAQNVVDVAATVADGDYFASVHDYDLLILDCLLPDGDGRVLCRDLRARHSLRGDARRLHVDRGARRRARVPADVTA